MTWKGLACVTALQKNETQEGNHIIWKEEAKKKK